MEKCLWTVQLTPVTVATTAVADGPTPSSAGTGPTTATVTVASGPMMGRAVDLVTGIIAVLAPIFLLS